MRTIEIDKELLLVEVPKDASDFELQTKDGFIVKRLAFNNDSEFVELMPRIGINSEIIGLIQTPNLDFDFEVNESWVGRFVIKNLGEFGYINYIERKVIENRIYETECQTKKQSFRTRIQKTIQDNGLYLVNPLGEKKYIPVKRCGAVNDFCSYGEIYCECKKRMKWQQAEEKTIKGNLLLIKKIRIMEKWCIKVTAENLPVVGKWFNENCQNGNAKFIDGWYLNTGYIGGYYPYPLMEDGRHYDRYVQDSYTEITFKQFKEKILKQPNQFQEILDKIREKIYYDDYDDEIVDFKDIEQIFAEYGITKIKHNF